MTVHREQSVKRRKNQQDATIRGLLLISVSTCFGHHYAHLQEIKDRVTAFGVLVWFFWMWLVAVVGRCVVGCDHYEGFCSVEHWEPPECKNTNSPLGRKVIAKRTDTK